MRPMRRNQVSPVFVGRDAELAALTAALDAAIAGDPAVVVLSGEAGVGKTRLVEEAAERASAAGARVLAGSCIEMGGEGLPFGPLAHAFRSLMRDTSPEELDAFVGPARSELAQVLPDLDPDSTPRTTPLGDGGTARLLELVVGVVERLAADRPLMFVIEDLHWADRSTLDLVALLVRALHADRVLVVVSFRSDELHRTHPLRPLVTGWERVRAVQRIELERLGRAEVACQLEAILGEPPTARLVDQVHERSEGNAFLVEEILGAVQSGADPDQLPLSLRDVLLARVERLDPSTQQLLRIAAAGGRAVSDRLLATVAGLEEADLDAALRDAIEHHVLVVDETERGYVFRHALTRDAIYGDTLPRERARIHTSYGEALSADPALAGGNVAVAAALALHWRAAHDLPRALAACVEAAQLAARYAPAEALGHLERALEIWPQVPDAAERSGIDVVEALRRAGQSAYAAGALDRSLAMFDEGLAELGPEADPERRALLMEARAATLLDSGRDDEARRDLERAAALLPDEPSDARALVLTALASQRGIVGDFHGARSAADQAVAAATGVGAPGREAAARMMLGMALVYLEGDRGLPELEAGLRLAEEAEDHAMALRGHVNLADALQTLGRSHDSAEVAERGMELATRVGLTRSVFGVLVEINLAEAQFHTGLWDEAHRVLTRAMDNGLASPFASVILDHRARIAALAGAMTTPGPTSGRPIGCCRHATAPSTPSPARSPPPRWRGRSATSREPGTTCAEPWSTRRRSRWPASPGSSCGWVCAWRPRPPSPRPTTSPRSSPCRASCPRRRRRHSPTARSRRRSRPGRPGATPAGRTRSRPAGATTIPTSSPTRCCARPRSRARRRNARAPRRRSRKPRGGPRRSARRRCWRTCARSHGARACASTRSRPASRSRPGPGTTRSG
jgi:tetratricopeptide (TPR) repeat protein